MAFPSNELLSNETPLLEKKANLVISTDEAGLSRFAFDQLLGLADMKGQEAIGGKVFVTSYRVVFKSHGFNRARGTLSIFLPNIVHVGAPSSLLTRKVAIRTQMHSYEFVVWGGGALVQAVQSATAALGRDGAARLGSLVIEDRNRLGAGFQVCGTADAINRVVLGAEKIPAVAGTLDGLEKNTFVELVSLVSSTDSPSGRAAYTR
jgi:hypothetical protein